MTIYLLVCFYILIFYFINIILIKNNFLLDNLSSSNHKKFIATKSIPLSGGIVGLSLIIFFFDGFDALEKTVIVLIYILGFLSDINKLSSPIKRIILQVILLTALIIISETFVDSIRIADIDFLLKNYYFFKIFFTLFCLLVFINGSNFIDGVNTLASGYFIIIISTLIYISAFKLNIEIDSDIQKLLMFLIVFVFFNLFSKSLLGDGGSYLISTIIGLYCVDLYSISNFFISPYFIALLLWYPALENLFSILRRQFFEKNKIKSADNLHLHHLIFQLINKKLKKKELSNNLTGILINLVIVAIIFLGTIFPNHTTFLICLIIFKTFIYSLSYIYLRYKIDL